MNDDRIHQNPSLKSYKYPLENQGRKKRKKRQENLDKKAKCEVSRT
jgi:hypothetical protein